MQGACWLPLLVLLAGCGQQAETPGSDGGPASSPAAGRPTANWTPPPGVPQPVFGIGETAGPATHFVDSTHPAATDGGNPNGTAAIPRRTLPAALTAGAVVEVRGGPYVLSSDTRWSAVGSAREPIFIRGVGSPVVRGDLRMLGIQGSYVVVEGLVFDGVNLGLGGDHLVLRRSELRNFSPPNHDATVYGQGSHIVIYDNHIHDNGDTTSRTERDVHGVKFSDQSANVWIVDNHMHGNGGDSIQIGDDRSDEPWAHHVYIARNRLHDDRENCVDVKQARDVVVSANECYGYRPVSSSDGTAMVVHNGAERVWFVDNRIHDAAVGIRSNNNDDNPGSTVYVVGNLIYRIHHAAGSPYDPNHPFELGAGIVAWTSPSVHIVNNTLHDVDAGIVYAGSERADLRIANNIVSSLAEPTHHVYVGQGSANSGSASLANLLLQAPARIKWGGRTPIYSLGSFRSANPAQCAGCVEANPAFVNTATDDLRPQPASAAVNAGTVDPVYANFSSRYGISIAVDLAGTPRPAGAGWDIGAFELAQGAAAERH